jgi:hypothetical protein
LPSIARFADSQHACADALIVRTYVDPASHSRLRTVGGARSGSSGRILSAQICTTVQPYRIRVSVSAVRCPPIRSVDPRSPTRSPVSSSRVRRSIPPTSLQCLRGPDPRKAAHRHGRTTATDADRHQNDAGRIVCASSWVASLCHSLADKTGHLS